jgi:hypothetical protein
LLRAIDRIAPFSVRKGIWLAVVNKIRYWRKAHKYYVKLSAIPARVALSLRAYPKTALRYGCAYAGCVFGIGD